MKLLKAAFQFTKFTAGRMIREAGLGSSQHFLATRPITYLIFSLGSPWQRHHKRYRLS